MAGRRRPDLVGQFLTTALAHLPALPGCEARANERARLAGRELERWRAVLAVALWLDEQAGADGLRRVGTTNGRRQTADGVPPSTVHGPPSSVAPTLFERMHDLALAYRAEQPSLEMVDLMALVIRALVELVAHGNSDVSDVSDISDVNVKATSRMFVIDTKSITSKVVEVAEEMEADIDVERITTRRIGRLLSKMRFRRDASHNNRRQWIVSMSELARFCSAYGIPLPVEATQIEIEIPIPT